MYAFSILMFSVTFLADWSGHECSEKIATKCVHQECVSHQVHVLDLLIYQQYS